VPDITELEQRFDAARITQEVTSIFTALQVPMDQSRTLSHRGETTDEVAMLNDFVGSLAYVKNGVKDVALDEFKFLHPRLKGTYTEQVIEEVRALSEFPVGRIRWAVLRARSCYSYHIDVDPIRYHVPLKTHPQLCMFIVDEVVLRMPEEGRLYSLNPRKLHTAINALNVNLRIHLLFDTYDPGADLMPYRRERLEGVYNNV
jgi:hypothetical protein